MVLHGRIEVHRSAKIAIGAGVVRARWRSHRSPCWRATRQQLWSSSGSRRDKVADLDREFFRRIGCAATFAPATRHRRLRRRGCERSGALPARHIRIRPAFSNVSPPSCTATRFPAQLLSGPIHIFKFRAISRAFGRKAETCSRKTTAPGPMQAKSALREKPAMCRSKTRQRPPADGAHPTPMLDELETRPVAELRHRPEAAARHRRRAICADDERPARPARAFLREAPRLLEGRHGFGVRLRRRRDPALLRSRRQIPGLEGIPYPARSAAGRHALRHRHCCASSATSGRGTAPA